MEIKNRQKMLLIAAGAGLLLLVGNSLVFDPLVASWKARAETITTLRQKVDDGTKMVQREQSLRSNWNEKRTNALPADQSQAEAQLFKSFDRWERASGITRVAIKPQWKEGDVPTYNTLECRVDYTGSIDRIKRFLYEVEKDPMGLKVENIEISSRDDNGRQLSLGLQVSGLQLNPQPAPQQP